MQSPNGTMHRDFVAEQLNKDPEFAAEYEQMRALVEQEIALAALAERAEEELAHALAALRQHRHMSQRDLAEVCRIKQPMINRLERAKQSPAFSTLVKLTAALRAIVQISEEGVVVRPAEQRTFSVSWGQMVSGWSVAQESLPISLALLGHVPLDTLDPAKISAQAPHQTVAARTAVESNSVYRTAIAESTILYSAWYSTSISAAAQDPVFPPRVRDAIMAEDAGPLAYRTVITQTPSFNRTTPGSLSVSPRTTNATVEATPVRSGAREAA